MLLKDEHWVEWSALRSKTGRDLSISRNFICPSPEDLAAHRRFDRKPPWQMPLLLSLLHGRRDIEFEKVTSTLCATTNARRGVRAFNIRVLLLLLFIVFLPLEL